MRVSCWFGRLAKSVLDGEEELSPGRLAGKDLIIGWNSDGLDTECAGTRWRARRFL